MSLTAQDIQRIASLARIELDAAQSAELLVELNAVLGLIDRLQAVDTTGVQPLTHVQDMTLRLRDDLVTETDQREAMQAVAPRIEEGLYLVPRVIE